LKREVIRDGSGVLRVRFPFDRSLVDRIKTLPNRRWNSAERHWWVPETDVVLLVDLLCDDRFSFDDGTRELYASMGGTTELETNPFPAARATLPGLFDDPPPSPDTVAPDAVASTDDFTVSRLNEKVKQVLASAFPTSIWLVGEISGFNKNAHKRHVGFQLVELEDTGRSVSQISATLFERTRADIERALREAGDPFRLEDEVKVRVKVDVELYVPWGSYRVIVQDIDLRYTLGEAARRREEIIRLLTEQGLVGLNSALPMPAFPLRVGLITSLGSDAFNDVRRTLEESGLAFAVTAHGARVQGRQTEPSVLNALDWFRRRADGFDVVLICRGGGSRTDLAWFDSEALGRAVATFPLPVVIGIGHEQDQSVLDAVGRRAKTPTAAARLLVDAVAEGIERIERSGREILELAAEGVADQRQRTLDRARRLVQAAGNRLQLERFELERRQQRGVHGARALLAHARERLVHWSTGIPHAATRQLERSRAEVHAILRAVFRSSTHSLGSASDLLGRLARTLAPAAGRHLGRERERYDARAQRLRLVDPRRVVERGYSILRLEDGKVLTRAAAAPRGTRVRAELREGALGLRSEGEDD
jgi:exodeoxyribonuclease VII large subunit